MQVDTKQKYFIFATELQDGLQVSINGRTARHRCQISKIPAPAWKHWHCNAFLILINQIS